MSERILNVRVRMNTSDFTRGIRGITSGTRAASRAQMTADRQVTREAQRGAASRVQSAQREQRERVSEANRASRSIVQLAQREQQALFRANQGLSRQRTRDHQTVIRQQREQGRARMRALAAGVGAAVGVGGAVLGRVQGYQAAFHMPTRDELMQGTMDRETRLIRLAHQSGGSASAIQGSVFGAARATGAGTEDLLAGLEFAQRTLATPDFDALAVFSGHLEEIAAASVATGAPVQDLIGALGQMRSQFGITEAEFGDMIGTLSSIATNSSIELGDLAANFSVEMGQFRNLRSGVSGVEAAREFAGTAEVIGSAMPTDPEGAATAFRAVMTELANSGTQRDIEAGLRRGGASRTDANVFDAAGHLSVAMPELISRMRAAHLDTPRGLQDAGIDNVRAIGGFQTLMHSMEGGSTQFQDLIASSSATGNNMIRSTNADLRGTVGNESARMRAQQEEQFAANGGELMRAELTAAGVLGDLTSRFPALTEAAGLASEALMGIGQFAIAGRLLGFGGGAAATGAAGAAAGGGGLTGLLATGTGALAAGGGGAIPLLSTLTNFLFPNVAGQGAVDMSAGPARSEGHLSAAARDELIAQRQQLNGTQGADLVRAVQEAQSRGTALTPETIRALAQAFREAVPAPPGALTPTSPGAPSSRRVGAAQR